MGIDMVGRDRELTVLDAALAARRPTLVAVVGEPGIGKTRLLAEVAARAESREMLVLDGRAAEFERDLPFAVWVDALDDHLRSREHEPIDELGGQDVVDELASVLPALANRSSGRASAPLLDERHRLHAAARSLLTTLAAYGPVLLLLDDLHWADAGSVDLISSLLRRPPQAPITLVAALRPHPARPRLAAAIDRAERDGHLTRLSLDALTARECDVLLDDPTLSDGPIPPELRAELRRESGGNPFYLQALARTTGLGATVPRSVRDAIAEELRTLPGKVRLVLDAAAVVGDPFEPDLVASAAGLGEDRVVEALDHLLACDLVRPTAVPRRFTMRHPLVRRAVHESAGAGWRLGAHDLVAEALRRRGAARTILAHHVALSARQGDAQAVELLTAAADESLARAPATATRWFRRALELLGPHASETMRVGLLEKLGTALVATGSLAEGRDQLVAALELVAPDAVADRARLAARCAGVEHRLGLLDAAHRRLDDVLTALPVEPTPERLSLLVELAADGFHRGRPDEMTAWAELGLEVAETLGDRAHAAAARGVLALAQVLLSHMGRAGELTAAAGTALDELTDDELATCLDGVYYLNMAEMYTERFEPMIEHATRAMAVARAARQGGLQGVLAQSHAFGAAIRGRLAEARAVYESAIDGERTSGTPYSLASILMNAAYCGIWLGELPAAIRVADEACALIGEVGESVISAYPKAALAWTRLEAGDPNQAAEMLQSGCGGPELPLLVGFWRCLNLEVLTRAELGRGRRDAAAAAAERATVLAAELEQDLPFGWACAARAAVLLDAGDAAEAAEFAAAAANSLATGGAPVEEGRARLLAGRALAAAGRRDDAVAQLHESATLFDRCGAAGLAADTARELRRHGYRTRHASSAATGLAALSTREREVAQLVAAGRSNPEIARELYLSTKTVESHLRHLFAKLGVSSRVEVAVAVHDHTRKAEAERPR